MSDPNVPELRESTVALLTAQIPSAHVEGTMLDPVQAVDFMTTEKPAVISVSMLRTLRQYVGPRILQVSGGIEVRIFTKSPERLDTTVAQVVDVLMSDPQWLRKFEDIDSFDTNYDYTACGDIDLSAAVMNVTGHWKEVYTVRAAPDLNSVRLTVNKANPFTGEPEGSPEFVTTIAT